MPEQQLVKRVFHFITPFVFFPISTYYLFQITRTQQSLFDKRFKKVQEKMND